MGVNIGWKKKDPRKLTYIDGGSQLHKILEDTYSGFPIELSEKDIPFLSGILACGYFGVKDLIGAIDDHGEIVIDAEW